MFRLQKGIERRFLNTIIALVNLSNTGKISKNSIFHYNKSYLKDCKCFPELAVTFVIVHRSFTVETRLDTNEKNLVNGQGTRGSKAGEEPIHLPTYIYLPVMAAFAVRIKVVGVVHFSPKFCLQSLQLFLFVNKPGRYWLFFNYTIYYTIQLTIGAIPILYNTIQYS